MKALLLYTEACRMSPAYCRDVATLKVKGCGKHAQDKIAVNDVQVVRL